MKRITLCTDASVGKKSSGFAYYLRADEGTIKEAWFAEETMTVNKAEVYALLRGLEKAKEFIYADETILRIYCDNTLCLQLVTGDFNQKTRKKYQTTIEMVEKLTDHYFLIEPHHVTAHTQNRSNKFYMNRWCDINARRQMKYLGKRPIRNKLYGLAGHEEAKRGR